MDRHIVRCGIINICQSAAISKIVKALFVTNLTQVRIICYSKVHTEFICYFYI